MPSVKAKTAPKNRKTASKPVKKKRGGNKPAKPPPRPKSDKLKKQYKKYVKRVEAENVVRAAKGLPLMEILPFEMGPPKEVLDEVRSHQWGQPKYERKPRELPADIEFIPWPVDIDGYPMYLNTDTMEFVPVMTQRHLVMAESQRNWHLTQLIDKGVKIPKEDYDRIKHYMHNRKFDTREVCNTVIKCALDGAHTFAEIFLELGIVRATHDNWLSEYPEYKAACKMASTIMDGKLTKEFRERWISGVTKDGDYLKVLERFGSGQWADPKTTAMQESTDALRNITIATSANYSNPQPPRAKESISENDPRWRE